MKTNKYMILEPIPAKDDECWGELVESFETSRISLYGTMIVVKMPANKTKVLPCLATHIKPDAVYNHKEILAELSGPAWTEPE